MVWARRLIEILIPESAFADSADELRRARLAAVFILFFSSMALPLTGVQVVFGASVIARVEFLAAVLALLLLPLLRWTRSVWLAANGLTTILAAAITIVTMFRGGFGKTVVMAFALVPMTALAIGGRVTGIFWLVVTIFLLTGIAIIQRYFGPLPEAPLVDPLATNYPGHVAFVLGTYFIMSVYVYLRQRAREDQRVVAERLATEERRRLATETEVRLLRSSRMAELGTLAAGVAHEINNPLTYILSNVEYLRENGDQVSVAERDEILAEAEDGARRIARIVRDIGTFSRIEPDTGARPIDLHNVLESSVNLLWNQIRHRARLRQDYGEIPQVMGNATRLAQVFVNVLSNAVQAIPADRGELGEIRITTGTNESGNVVVTIADDGIGMTADAKDRVFEPFYTTKPIGVGTGLGLSICYGIVTKLGGSIGIESGPDLGTTVTIELEPEAGGVAADGRASTVQEVTGQPVPPSRILVVDDDPSVVGIVRRLLKRHEVVTATGAQQALDLLAQDGSFDVILCDVMMPDITGLDLFARLEQNSPALLRKLVFMTGGAFTQEAQEFIDRIDQPCLEKPFSHGELDQAIDQVVRGRGHNPKMG